MPLPALVTLVSWLMAEKLALNDPTVRPVEGDPDAIADGAADAEGMADAIAVGLGLTAAVAEGEGVDAALLHAETTMAAAAPAAKSLKGTFTN
jgi:hypothetical protein